MGRHRQPALRHDWKDGGVQPAITVVIVSYNSAPALEATLPALKRELRDTDEVIVVDNASQDNTVALTGELMPAAKVVETGGNLGFAAGCNRGAEQAKSPLVCFLNPDAVPQPGWRDAIGEPATRPENEQPAAWQALVASDGGQSINSAGGVLHFTGIAWAGDKTPPGNRPGFLSGACLVMDREKFLQTGGFAEDYFLYHEDVDLSLRLILEGGKLEVIPDAIVDHDYEFHKGAAKWRYLERNRWATIIRTYPASLIILSAPVLAAAELAIWLAALTGGWAKQKLLSVIDSWRRLPGWLRQREQISARRSPDITPRKFTDTMVATLDSPYLGGPARSQPVALLLKTWWRLIRALLPS